MPTKLNTNGFLQLPGDYSKLLFYKKAMVLYDLTYRFCERFLPQYGDRTVDQMVQAARSGKQNIVEGMEDGMTSVELQIKLLNVSRSSLKELKEDYEDYLRTRGLTMWDESHPRYRGMLDYCFSRHTIEDYSRFFEIWNAEEFCNVALTLLHQSDKGLVNYLAKIEENFLQEGGIKEKMAVARRKSRGC